MSPERPPTDAPDDGPTRVALVGAGFIADFHAPILRATPGVELVAVCDADLERAEAAGRRHGIGRSVRTIAELVPLGVRVAHLLVPPPLHAALAREALEAGIGVLVEKPLALASSDARDLGRLARERGLPLGVNHNAVHHPAFARLLRRVRRGEIGRIEHVQVTLAVPLRQLDARDFSHWMFREPRNVVFEQGPHPFSQLVELVGAPERCETTLLSSRELHPGQVFHDRWLAAASAGGGTAEVLLSFGGSFPRSTIQVLGSDGSLQADLVHDHLEVERKTQWLDFWNSFLAGARRAACYLAGATRVLSYWLRQTLGLGRRMDAFYAGMRESIRAFHAAVREGRPVPFDAEHGARVLEWCEALTRDVPARDAGDEPLPEPGPPREGEVCVLGGSGFIGRPTVEALLARGLPVTAVVRRAHGLPPVLVENARSGRVRLLRGSLEDPGAIRRAVEGARVVLQLATGGGASWEAVERSMVRGTEAVAEACVEAGVERFVYVSSTAALYLGHDADVEVVEDDVEADPRPEERAIYARGKVLAEWALARLARERGLRLVIARPGVVLGREAPLQHSGLGLWVRDNHCVGWGRGSHPLPLVLVEDVADALARIAAHEGDELDGKALNLCSRVPLSARDVVAAMRAATGRELHFHPRPLWLSQAMEVGKWIVKRAGGRKDAAFPSWRDLKSRALVPPLGARRARAVLGWRPVEEPEAFLAAVLSTPAPPAAPAARARERAGERALSEPER